MRPARRLLVALVAATLIGGLGLAALPGPAGAHGATGTMGIEVVPGPAPLTAEVRVLLEYATDREVVPGATVVGTATGPGGQTVAPTPLADRGQGVYAVTLTMPAPGAWTVSVTAADPVAAAEATVTVSASPSTTGASGSLDRDLGDPADDRAAQRSDPSDASGGPSPALLAVIAVVLVAGAGLAFMLVRRH